MIRSRSVDGASPDRIEDDPLPEQPHSLADSISQIPLFSGLSRENLARLVGKLEQVDYAAGQTVFSQGDGGDALYVVHQGAAEVLIEKEGLEPESVAMLGPGECFGEMALFSGEPRSATVRTLVDSSLVRLEREDWEDLITRHKSLSLYFCKVLSQRLATRETVRARKDLTAGMEAFLASLPPNVQELLLETSLLRRLDTGAIENVFNVSDAGALLESLASTHSSFVHRLDHGEFKISDYFCDFLRDKSKQQQGPVRRSELHLALASYFTEHQRWGEAVYHLIEAEAWAEAVLTIRDHAEELLATEAPEQLLVLLDAVEGRLPGKSGRLTRLRAQACIRLGEIDSAIDAYDAFLSERRETANTAEYYRQLADLHQMKGDAAAALVCLEAGLNTLQGSAAGAEAMEAIKAMGALQQNSGRHQQALEWGKQALTIASRFTEQARTGWLERNRNLLALLLAAGVGLGVWSLPPTGGLDERAVHFMACLAAAVILWMLDVFEQHVVALVLLLAWVLLDIVAPPMALSGFSKSSWFFVFGVLGMGAAVTKTGLLYRIALEMLRWIPPSYRIYSLMLSSAGIITTPLLPTVKARLAISSPLAQEIAETMGFKPRSNGCAGLTLSAFIGFSQLTFMFLTGATVGLIGWGLIPEPTRSEFSWSVWFLAALPAGLLTQILLYLAILLLFPIPERERVPASVNTLRAQLRVLGPLTRAEWIGSTVLALAVLGFLTKPLHGVSETWVAVAAVSVFFLSGLLDKDSFRNNIDWGYLIFLGVILSLTSIMTDLGLDQWFKGVIQPVMNFLPLGPLGFLMVIALIVYLVRLFFAKIPAVILLMLTLGPLAAQHGIHPGALLLTILMTVESWFLPYQTPSYQIAYYSTDGRSFSHAQARKVMAAKFIVSFLAIAVSVPYWEMLGLIR